MAEIPALSEADAGRYLGGTLERGRPYYAGGALSDLRREGRTLHGRCQGTAYEPYRVRATFDAQSITRTHCSCPVGGDGYCKHVAALLLAWCHSPEEFVAIEELDAALGRRSKEELIALIKQMLRRQPDLEVLLETPLPVPGKPSTPVSPETFRRQAAAVFRRVGYDYEWGALAGMADELGAVLEIGDSFLQQSEGGNAAAVYQAVAAEVMEHFDAYQDDEGTLIGVLMDCVSGLGQCLAGREDPPQRERILRTLLEIYDLDLRYGSVGIADGVPDLLLDETTPEERQMLAAWVREQVPKGRDWAREAYGGLLLELEADTLDDESFFRICRETGRVYDLVDRLLALGRLEEAIAEAQQVSDYTLIELANLFVQHANTDTAERLMQERSTRTQDTRVYEWLKQRYAEHGDKGKALELAQRIFELRPSLEGYQEIRELATAVAGWENLRPRLRAHLAKVYPDLLIHVYLDEGEIDQALEAVKSIRGSRFGFFYPDTRLTVARAAKETRPAQALEIYRNYAESLIAQRGRQNYQTACTYLKKVRDLYERLGEPQNWASYLDGLREQNRGLRALREEMAAAGL
jgi:uncharacterized Zn finger protein